jgi:hypothetical protein
MVSPWMENGTVVDYIKNYGYANVDKLVGAFPLIVQSNNKAV